MDSEIEKYVKKQRQLQEKIEELFAENKLLKNNLSVLCECLSLEKIKRKIFELENKQKLLKSLENVITKLQADVKPLEYLKQTLQKQFMVSTVSNDDSVDVERKDTESSDLIVNSGCAIETLDSASDVSSEESIVVLSEYDVVSDGEVCDDTETSVNHKVMYAEALQMAASVHLSLNESFISNIGASGFLSNENDQIKDVDHRVQSVTKDSVTLMNASSKSEQLLEMYDVVNKKDISKCDENSEIKLECDTGETTTHKDHHQPCHKSFDAGIRQLDNEKHNNVLKCINNSWVKVDTNESLDIPIENESFVEKGQATAESQKGKIITKVNTEADVCIQNDQLCNHQFESKDISEIKSYENVCNVVDQNDKNEIHKPVCSINTSKVDFVIKSSILNTEDLLVSRECSDKLIDVNVKPSSSNDDEKSRCCIDKFSITDLNVELLNGIHRHGIRELMTLQLKFMSFCINRRDIIFHSYPCIGKSTVSFISLLQMIDTNLNECQAVVLVPTLELALSAQKTIKSLGKFLNVSTRIGGFDVPRKVSPVPHVVISTPRSLFDMINCSSLCKHFIKILIIDDADEMFNCSGFFNQIRHILLFLNNDRQLIILSTSKLEEIIDQFSDIMQNPEYIVVPDEKPSLNDIIQYYVNLSEEWKFDAICELYEILKLTQTVVYCDSWDRSLEIAEKMRLKTYTVSVVHNEMDISQRRLILRQFRSGISRMLITTELLKGEDFSDVMLVINYDLPKSSKNYIRKIVGCFGRRVKVINFITKNDTTAKDNIETAFNVNMLYLPKDVTDSFLSNLGSNNDQIFSLLEL